MIQSKICELLGIQYPVFQGGMAWIADGKLAAAVSEGGGLGIIAAGNAPAGYVREQIRIAGHQSTGSDHTIFTNHRAIQYDGTHTHDTIITNGTTMYDGTMADGTILADGNLLMQNRIVLNITAVPDADASTVPSKHRTIPDTYILTKLYISYYRSILCNIICHNLSPQYSTTHFSKPFTNVVSRYFISLTAPLP